MSPQRAATSPESELSGRPPIPRALQEFYKTHSLTRFADALDDIGVMEAFELNDVTDEELAGVGMSVADIQLVRAPALATRTLGASLPIRDQYNSEGHENVTNSKPRPLVEIHGSAAGRPRL